MPSSFAKALSFALATSLVVLSAAAQTAPTSTAKTAAQVPSGATATISPAQGVTAPAADKPNGILKSALTPTTRQTLLDAMNSVAPAASH
jgi:hypothetical protein